MYVFLSTVQKVFNLFSSSAPKWTPIALGDELTKKNVIK